MRKTETDEALEKARKMIREVIIHRIKFDVIREHYFPCGAKRILEIGRPGLRRIAYATEFANGKLIINV